MNWEQLREEPLTVLVSQRWAKRDPHELRANEPFIRYERELGGGKQAARNLRKAGITPTERFELSSLAAVAMLVDRGLGVALAPDAATPGNRACAWSGCHCPACRSRAASASSGERASLRGRLIRALVDEARRVVAAH